jgi:3-phenylpropionate/trans-cinnamate dioxygenase ferredoxin reductase subunit
MEYIGHTDPDDSVVVRGELDERKFIAFWLRAGRVTDAMNVNVWDVAEELRAIVAAERSVSVESLAGPSVALVDLA